mgnify:CR=1 FL=1
MIAFFAPGPFELLILLIITSFTVVITVLPLWLICEKAGFPGWYGLAALIPILNIVLLFFLAFADWPALRGISEVNRDISP